VDAFIVMDVVEAARAAEALGQHIIHMEVGQPGTGAPAGANAAVARALAEPLGYTVSLGLPALRAGIAGLYQRWYGVDLDPARVIVTSGSSGAFLLAFTALFDGGDRVGLGEPGYPSYRQILKALDLVPVGIPSRDENRLQPVPADLQGLDLQGLIVASPGNPTGTMLDRKALAALMQVAQARDISFVSDEIYHGLHYGARATSALEVSDEAYVINSFSKYFSMTGWRVGWMVVPEDHIRTVERLAQNLFVFAGAPGSSMNQRNKAFTLPVCPKMCHTVCHKAPTRGENHGTSPSRRNYGQGGRLPTESAHPARTGCRLSEANSLP
jgi:aspartate/methionine/tyrosine aminotransferase